MRQTRLDAPATTARGLLAGVAGGLEPDGVVVCDMTKISFHAITGLDLPPGSRFLFPGLLSMGFGLPGALGASLARPDAQVVALIGDGSLLSVLPELHLARGLAANLTVVLLDDGGYGLPESRVPESLADRTCRFEGPSWSGIAEAFGVELLEAAPEELGPAIAKSAGRPRIVRVEAGGIELDWRGA